MNADFEDQKLATVPACFETLEDLWAYERHLDQLSKTGRNPEPRNFGIHEDDF